MKIIAHIYKGVVPAMIANIRRCGYALVVVAVCTLVAAYPLGARGAEPADGEQSESTGGKFSLGSVASNVRSSAAEADKVVGAKKERKSSAWTLTWPLAMHEQSTIDTLLYNYQRQAIPSLVSDAYATTGNLGASGQTQIFFERRPFTTFFFENALDAWLVPYGRQKFYNVFIPMTLLSYNFGGTGNSNQDRLRATFAGNVNRRIGIGGNIDYLYSKGSYNNQADKNFTFGLSGYYRGDRYEMQAFYNQYSMLQKENGGITNDLYITDPAALQGGDDKIETKSIPTRLSAAHSRVKGAEFFMNHAYNVGYWRDEQVNDTLTREVYVPVTKFLYSFDYRYGHHNFRNDNVGQGDQFWQNRYFTDGKTYDDNTYTQIANTVGIQLLEGFRKWVKFGLSAFATYEYRYFTQPSIWYAENVGDPGETGVEQEGLTPFPEGFSYLPKTKQHLLFVGGELAKRHGSILTYNAKVTFGIMGAVAGDVQAAGNVRTRFKMLGDTVAIRGYVDFKNVATPYLLKHYVSNHFAWDNSFGQIRTLRFGGELTIPWTRTVVSAGFENAQNYVYFGPDGMPRQNSGNVQVFTARLEQKLHFGIWNWNNTVTYQTSSDHNVLPLPALAIYSNMYLNAKLFRVLDMQFGVDCNYYTRYNGVVYQPATMAFCVQAPDNAIKVGNFPFMDLYLTCKLYKTRFFILWSHFNQGWMKKNYFSMPHYPLNPSRIQFGVSVDFAN